MYAFIRNGAQNRKETKYYLIHFGFTVRCAYNSGRLALKRFQHDQTRLNAAWNLRIILAVFHLPRRFRASQAAGGSLGTNARVVFACVECSFGWSVVCVCGVEASRAQGRVGEIGVVLLYALVPLTRHDGMLSCGWCMVESPTFRAGKVIPYCCVKYMSHCNYYAIRYEATWHR